MKEIRFCGGRFAQAKGLLDIDVLPELVQYKRILIQTAKEEWRRRNPEKRRLRKGFEDNVRVALDDLREGSTSVALVRLVEADDDALEFHTPDELDRAAEIMDATSLAADSDESFPNDLPAQVIPMFGSLGQSLRDDEYIETTTRDPSRCARFDARIRQRIIERGQSSYEDEINLEGEVRMASLRTQDGGTFTLHLEDGIFVDGVFSTEQESEVTEALHKHHTLRIRIRGLGEFSRDGKIKRILRVDFLEKHSFQEERFDPNAKPIWEALAEIGKSVPEEEWAKIPQDASVNLDYYLYGSAKEEP
jgi:hypothetical protein